jgi:hypothetical protein
MERFLRAGRARVSAGILLSLACLLALAGVIAAQQSKAPPVPLTQANIADYLSRLHASSQQDYVVQGQIYLKGITGASEEWNVRNITFQKGATIFIGTTNLTVTVDGQLIPEDNYGLVFAAFPPGDSKAPKGADGGNGGLGPTSPVPASGGGQGGRGSDGQPGQNGKKAGNLTLRLRKLPSLTFTVSLKGQDGGDGGNGGAGGPGGTGQKGRPGDSGAFGCNRGGDNGGPGGRGGDGGSGGIGGFCGPGGLTIVLVPDAIKSRMQDSIQVDRTAASHGASGRGGPGGPGGQGGQGGDGSGFCGGGGPGAPGGGGGGGGIPAPPTAECQLPMIQVVGY